MNRHDWIGKFGRNLSDAIRYPFESWRGTIGFVLVTFGTYTLLILSTMPEFALQMLGDGLHWFDYVLVSLTESVYLTDGATGLGIIVSYALLTGVAVVNAVAQLRLIGLSGATSVSGVLPGLVASGCASCGAGLLAFLGFAGGLTLLPFDGTLLQVGGLALLLFFLGRAGHPERCVVSLEGSQ
ncbi:hypothetical protein [Natronolimnohabitans innermongolicus]|uniref:Uncharacterized protein n=1 Tax=Natronolimnohabitans innermongolicus JCM 12255 TaxID=1227499 RepID=L9WPD1_9EURY|nr:hypothetical protein [Natronolimnohabitans innermongolicus]ELY50203.1 hypothetical protein C493_19591 [Natronolimnohabitans innermongolicus JCM 12255]